MKEFNASAVTRLPGTPLVVIEGETYYVESTVLNDDAEVAALFACHLETGVIVKIVNDDGSLK